MKDLKMNLKEIKESIKNHILKVIQENIVEAVANSSEWHLLKGSCPSINELVFYVTTSGFNDGDPEYTLFRPLFLSHASVYSSDLEDTYKVRGEYDEDVWEAVTEEDHRIYEVISKMDLEDQKRFTERYTDAVSVVFDSIGEYCPHNEIVRIQVGEVT